MVAPGPLTLFLRFPAEAETHWSAFRATGKVGPGFRRGAIQGDYAHLSDRNLAEITWYMHGDVDHSL
jgi:hypothetical protein